MKKRLTENLTSIGIGSFSRNDQLNSPDISVTTTPCRYGGKRNWFSCPLIKNGKKCNQRVGILYKSGSYWGCRNCFNLTYRSRVERKTRLYHAVRVLKMSEMINELEKNKKRSQYRGKPTRKRKRLEKFYALARISSSLITNRGEGIDRGRNQP